MIFGIEPGENLHNLVKDTKLAKVMMKNYLPLGLLVCVWLSPPFVFLETVILQFAILKMNMTFKANSNCIFIFALADKQLRVFSNQVCWLSVDE